jgi:hypothetical protein
MSSALTIERDTATSRLDVLRNLTITSIDHKKLFAAALVDVQARWKKLDVREKEITRPGLASIESTRELFRGPKTAYKNLEISIKEKLADYEVRCALEVQAATVRAQELAAAGDAEGARTALMSAGEASVVGETDVEGMTLRYPWTFEILNIELLPRGYILPDMIALKDEMRRQLAANPDESPAISGVKFYKKLQVAGSKKR